MKVFLVILVAFVGIVAVISMTGVFDEAPPMPAAVEIPVPDGAPRLKPGTGPDDVAMSVAVVPVGTPAGVGGGGAGGGSGGGSYVGLWTPEGGWYANLMQMKKGDGVTRMSLEVQGVTLGSVFLYLTVRGDVGQIAQGRKVTFRGRIVSITPSDRIDIKPHKIELDQVTVLRIGG